MRSPEKPFKMLCRYKYVTMNFTMLPISLCATIFIAAPEHRRKVTRKARSAPPRGRTLRWSSRMRWIPRKAEQVNRHARVTFSYHPQSTTAAVLAAYQLKWIG